ncbi:DVL family [Musa troglodytarum]|uniref:DVL family n=1 Tax=Musa troglodytarum TaxID=320322 RepID=A0A9E7I6P0_9LILI|nr:DVL family [Musa troglodytarum]
MVADVKQNGNHMDLANDHSSISSFDALRFHCGVMSPYPTCLAIIPTQTKTMKKPAARSALASNASFLL